MTKWGDCSHTEKKYIPEIYTRWNNLSYPKLSGQTLFSTSDTPANKKVQVILAWILLRNGNKHGDRYGKYKAASGYKERKWNCNWRVSIPGHHSVTIRRVTSSRWPDEGKEHNLSSYICESQPLCITTVSSHEEDLFSGNWSTHVFWVPTA